MAGTCHKCNSELPESINPEIVDRDVLSKEIPAICKEDVIIKHNNGAYYTLYNELEGERLTCHACLYNPTFLPMMPEERERRVFQLTDTDIRQYQSSEHKVMLEEEEEMQRDLEIRDRMHSVNKGVSEQEAELMKGILEKQKKIQERIIEDELALRDYEQSLNASGTCPPQKYEDIVKQNEELPLYQNASLQRSIMFHEESDSSDSYDSSDDSEDETDSDDETSTNAAGEEIFHLVMQAKSSEMSREWLTKAKAFFLYQYLCFQKCDETDEEIIADTVLSIASSLDDTEFLKFTKVMASLCMLSNMSSADPSQRLASFLRMLLFCCNEHGYLTGACVLQCIHALLKVIENGQYDDPQLLKMVPSFSQATVWCVCSFTSPFTKITIDAKQLMYLVHIIQTYQIPLFKVKDACIKDSFPSSVISYLKDYVSIRPDKGIVQIEHEFLKSGTVTEYMLNKIVTTLSSGQYARITDISIPEMKGALSRIASGVSDMQDDDLLLVLQNLNSAVFQTMGYKARITQLASVCILLLSNQQGQNRLLEVLTGEGKSCIIAMFAAALGIRGIKVDIVTSSPILARRDTKTWAGFYQIFGLTVADNTRTKALLESSNSDEILAKAYKSTVVYGTVLSFSGDVLREVFSMDEIRCERGFQAAIVDEVDMLMMDEGISLTYLSHRVPVLRHIEPVIALVWSSVQQNTPLLTEDERRLFAGTPDYFHHIIFDRINKEGISEEEFSTQLMEMVSQFHYDAVLTRKLKDFFDAEGDDSEKQEAIEEFESHDMLKLIILLNRSNLACDITVYSLTQDGVLELVESSDNLESNTKVSVVVQDKGMVFPLFTFRELKDGIEEMILNKLGISDPDSDPDVVLQTEDGTVQYYPGIPGAINTIISKCLSSVHLLHLMAKANIAKDKIERVLTSKDKETALESFLSDDMCIILYELENFFPHRLIVYHYQGNRLIPIQKSKCEFDTIPVLVMDKGKVCILQEVQDDCDELTLHTKDGERFIHGTVDFFHNIIFKNINPVELLNMLELLDGSIDLDSMQENGEISRC